MIFNLVAFIAPRPGSKKAEVGIVKLASLTVIAKALILMPIVLFADADFSTIPAYWHTV